MSSSQTTKRGNQSKKQKPAGMGLEMWHNKKEYGNYSGWEGEGRKEHKKYRRSD